MDMAYIEGEKMNLVCDTYPSNANTTFSYILSKAFFPTWKEGSNPYMGYMG